MKISQKQKSILSMMLFGGSLLLAGPVNAAPITTLFGTGLDGAGTPLALGASDPHYTVTEAAAASAEVLSAPLAAYFSNDANSQWIWQNANGSPASVTRTFHTTFDLTGLDPVTAVINGAWGTDNQGLEIRINGVLTGIELLGITITNFNQLHAFVINSGFQSGINTLDFKIQDNGTPAAFRTELTGTADVTVVPIPPTIFLFSSSVLGLILARKKWTKE